MNLTGLKYLLSSISPGTLCIVCISEFWPGKSFLILKSSLWLWPSSETQLVLEDRALSCIPFSLPASWITSPGRWNLPYSPMILLVACPQPSWKITHSFQIENDLYSAQMRRVVLPKGCRAKRKIRHSEYQGREKRSGGWGQLTRRRWRMLMKETACVF